MRGDFGLRRRLAEALCGTVEGMAQIDAACALGVDHSDVSRLRNGRVERFTVDRLLGLLERSGYDVELRLRSVSRVRRTAAPPRVSVVCINRLGQEAEMEGRPAPRKRHRSSWAEEIEPDF